MLTQLQRDSGFVIEIGDLNDKVVYLETTIHQCFVGHQTIQASNRLEGFARVFLRDLSSGGTVNGMGDVPEGCNKKRTEEIKTGSVLSFSSKARSFEDCFQMLE